MKKQIFIIAIAIGIYSCGSPTSKPESAENQELLSLTDEDAIKLETINPEEIELILKDNPNAIEPEQLTTEEFNKNFLGRKPEEHKNEELPHTYRNRTFIKNLSSLTYKLDEIPGYIVRYDKKLKDYKIVSLVRLVKNNAYPEMKLIDDGIIYSSKINSGANFNATALIGGLSVDSKSIMELIIQDVMLSIVPDTLILKDEIKRIAENIPAADRKDYYYVKGTTLTLVNNKKYKEQKFEAKVNSTYVTASGKVYASNDKFSRERLVSLDLISLDDILTIKNTDLIQ
jgi:hypothetical protein